MTTRGPRTALLALALTLTTAATAAAQSGLPSVDSGPRPGPDVLYADPVVPPQLENAGPWTADPILVSGAQSYRDGEWLYQDFLFDDHGAAGLRDPSDPFTLTDFLFSPKAGTVTYPTDPAFANNAADLVELRVRPLPDATAFRVTLNSLTVPDRTAFTIALGDSGRPVAWPHGAGVRSPARLFLTVHGSEANLREAGSNRLLGPPPRVSVDRRRRQVDVRVPHAAWNPGHARVRMTIGVGLWDGANNRYLAPGGLATETRPGGAGPLGAALFNVGPRFHEPMPDVTVAGLGLTIADAAAGAAVDGSWWRERAQANALGAGDVSAFAAEVDFGKLAARARDDSGVPRSGPINRILASRYEFGQGVDHERVCFDIAGGGATHPSGRCDGRFLNALQPYALYIPRKPAPARGYGLTLLLHSLSANYNQYSASNNQSQLGERGAGSLVATPNGRGPDGFYTDLAEADTFEVWADVARHYPVDPDWVAVTGYSMGGFGTYRLAARWPDLFARGASIVGAPDDIATLPSLRNVPLLTWAAALDELVNIGETEEATRELQAAGLRFVSDLFPTADHLTLATNDEYGPVADFLGEHRVDRDPPHVTYVVAPRTDSERAGAVADHAYWVSGLRLRDAEAATNGRIDVRSDGFGVAPHDHVTGETGVGVLEGGGHGPMPYVRRSQNWTETGGAPRADRLTVRARNVGVATIDARRARVSCSPQLSIDSDGPLDLRIACPPARPRACTRLVRLRLARVRGRRIVSVSVTRRGRVLKRKRGRDIRAIAVRRPTTRAFALRVRARTSGGRKARSVTVLRTYPRCG